MAIQKTNSGKKGKGGKGGQKKRTQDPFAKKDWYMIKAPNVFSRRHVGRTPVTRTAGTKNALDGLKGRVIEVNLADLQEDEDQAYRNIKLQVQEIQGNSLLTNFYGLNFTTDKLRSLVRKWQTLIECHVDAKTSDGYLLRVFVIGFTNRRPNQIRKTSYAQTSQVDRIRRRMSIIVRKEVTKSSLKRLVAKFIPNSIGRKIERRCANIYPLKDVHIRKVKMIKAPRMDNQKIMEMYQGVKNIEELGKKLVGRSLKQDIVGDTPAPKKADPAPAKKQPAKK